MECAISEVVESAKGASNLMGMFHNSHSSQKYSYFTRKCSAVARANIVHGCLKNLDWKWISTKQNWWQLIKCQIPITQP